MGREAFINGKNCQTPQPRIGPGTPSKRFCFCEGSIIPPAKVGGSIDPLRSVIWRLACMLQWKLLIGCVIILCGKPGQTPHLADHISPVILHKLKGEVRTINDRNICERRSCMKNNGKSPTFKFVSGEERRPSEVQPVSRGWRLPGATHSSADLSGSENDWKFRLQSCQSWKASSLSLGVVAPTSINKYRMKYVGLRRDNLRAHFVFRPRHAPE